MNFEVRWCDGKLEIVLDESLAFAPASDLAEILAGLISDAVSGRVDETISRLA